MAPECEVEDAWLLVAVDAATAAELAAETMLVALALTLLTSLFIELIADSALLLASPVAVDITLLKLDSWTAASLVAVKTIPEA
jgi:hypothetical protein